ncbi:MAG: hypothetical protein IKT23_00135 [Clostridia bacterium]|nr:hypothetical protein [Clostridia bacterium]MBR5985280.1 hypothetical protein [Clostridia bacterium]MBR6498077.1 hypothetical protein [Clostridia bacterium]
MIPEARRRGAIDLYIAKTGGSGAPACLIKGARAVKAPPEPVVTLAGERLYPRNADEAEYRFHISGLCEANEQILTDVMLDYMEGCGTYEYDVTVYLDGEAVKTLPARHLVTDMKDVIVIP